MQQLADPTAEGARVLTVCNACRYCEQYCPVFTAMEQRLTFANADVNYLANLCHNCGECLYACQYAPPHEFAINVPQALARARVQSYVQYAWPAPLGAAFKHHGVLTATLLAAVMILVLAAAAFATNPSAVLDAGTAADFYGVVPHAAMVALFGSVFVFVVVALAIGARRFWRDLDRSPASIAPGLSTVRRPATISGPSAIPDPSAIPGKSTARDTTSPTASAVPGAIARGGAALRALRDIVTLRHLRASGEPCATAEDVRTPWRRRFHHATFYGFLLCFASTVVAAFYHGLGREAPYAYASVPVLLGALGGIGLLAGPLGLLLQRRGRDPALSDAAQENLDRAFLVLLWLTSASGLLLLALRHHPAMGILLLVHLGVVLALFLTLPYGKFVHGIYRAAALLKHAREETSP
jgi:citrate/tricarballylate utilization protein